MGVEAGVPLTHQSIVTASQKSPSSAAGNYYNTSGLNIREWVSFEEHSRNTLRCGAYLW
jgi:hypothetical protein